MRVAAVCGAAVVAAVFGMSAAGAVGGPEADLAYHGSVDLAAGEVDVRFTPHNLGSAAVPDPTVRISWSEPLAEKQALPAGCVRADDRAVTCRLGPLAAGEVGERIGLRVRLQGAPSEVLLEFDTVASDTTGSGTAGSNTAGSAGAMSEVPGGGPQRVLALDTGDTYYF
ncbi:hypothetical protein [Streptomyces sp. NPDC093568]|uniref:hypothetical protein n=1 Tax=Streptomyces sp. NPDC093568 TaxID=3366041 RepID=UPI003820FC5C